MRQTRIMALMCIVICVFAFHPPISANSSKPISVSIVEASNSGVIHVRAKGLGGHMGKCVSMDLYNVKDYPVEVLINAGNQLKSMDPDVQDILVGRAQKVILAAGEEKSIEIYGFCAEAGKEPPTTEDRFGKIEMAKPQLVKLAQYLDEKRYPMSMSQNAVWVVSDGKSITTVRNDDNASIVLQQFVSELTGRPIPPMFKVEGFRLRGTFDYTVSNYGIVTLILVDENGRQVKALFVKQNQQPQVGYRHDYNINIANLKKGKYYLRLFSANRVIKQEEIKL